MGSDLGSRMDQVTSRGPLQTTRFSDLILLTLFQRYQKLVSLCLSPSSTASDPDVGDTVINITMYMLKVITISFYHSFFSILERLRYLLLSMHWAFPLLFCFLHLAVI